MNYQSPSRRAGLGRLAGRMLLRLARRNDPWHDEPHRSHWSPEQMAALHREHGFVTVRDDDLGRIARDLGLSGDAVGPSLADGRVSVADRR